MGIQPTYHLINTSDHKIESEPLNTARNILDISSSAYIMAESNILGVLGEIDQHTLESFDLDKSSGAIFFELDLNSIVSCISNSKNNYVPISKFPEAYRDIAIVVNEDILSSTIQNINQSLSESLSNLHKTL